jgi:hypothetical protein
VPASEEDDEDSEISDNESEYDSEDEDEEDTHVDIDMVTNAFVARGYDVKDALSLLLCSYSKTDAKYTRDYIAKLNGEFDDIMEEIDSQQQENEDFAKEDINIWIVRQEVHVDLPKSRTISIIV